MRDDAVLRRALPLGRGLGRYHMQWSSSNIMPGSNQIPLLAGVGLSQKPLQYTDLTLTTNPHCSAQIKSAVYR